MNKIISVVIVNWNGKKWLANCFEDLKNQTNQNFEIIFVDNASSDDSVCFIKQNYPNVRIVENQSNLGFAAGNNSALTLAQGEFILLLNNDTRIPPNYLQNFIGAFLSNPKIGAAQSKIIRMDNPELLDSCGSFWTNSTLLYHYGVGKKQSLKKYNTPFPVFTNKGASMMISRKLIDDIKLFDDDFWCYYEETDFCHRVWLSGYECWYLPSSEISHAIGGTSVKFRNSEIHFNNFKNKLLSYLKNFELETLLIVIPIFLILSISISFLWVAQGKFSNSLSIYKAFIWNIKNIQKTLQKRRIIQSRRVVSDKAIFIKIKRAPKLKYYYGLIFNKLDSIEDE